MNSEKAWRRYQEAEDAYYSARARPLATDYEPVVRRALNSAPAAAPRCGCWPIDTLVKAAAASADEEVREVAEDFS